MPKQGAAPRPNGTLANRLRMRIGDPVVRFMARRRRSESTGILITTRKGGSRRETPVKVWERDGQRYVIALYGLSWWARDVRAGRPVELDLAGRRTAVTVAELHAEDAVELWRWFAAAVPHHAQRYAGISATPTDAEIARVAADYPSFRID